MIGDAGIAPHVRLGDPLRRHGGIHGGVIDHHIFDAPQIARLVTGRRARQTPADIFDDRHSHQTRATRRAAARRQPGAQGVIFHLQADDLAVQFINQSILLLHRTRQRVHLLLPRLDLHRQRIHLVLRRLDLRRQQRRLRLHAIQLALALLQLTAQLGQLGAQRLHLSALIGAGRPALRLDRLYAVQQHLLVSLPAQPLAARRAGHDEFTDPLDRGVRRQFQFLQQPGDQRRRRRQLRLGGDRVGEIARQRHVDCCIEVIFGARHHLRQRVGLLNGAVAGDEKLMDDGRPAFAMCGRHPIGPDFGAHSGVIDNDEAHIAQRPGRHGLCVARKCLRDVLDRRLRNAPAAPLPDSLLQLGDARLQLGQLLLRLERLRAGQAQAHVVLIQLQRHALEILRGQPARRILEFFADRIAGHIQAITAEPRQEGAAHRLPRFGENLLLRLFRLRRLDLHSHRQRLAAPGAEPGHPLFHQIPTQRVFARLRRRGQAGRRETDLAPWRHIVGQFGALIGVRESRLGVARVQPLIAQAHRVGARLEPGLAAIVAQSQRHCDQLTGGQDGRHLLLQEAHLVFRALLQLVRPGVAPLDRLAQVFDDSLLTFDAPTIAGHLRPAVEDQGTNHLVARLAVPPVNFAIGALHPGRITVRPGDVALIGFRDVAGQAAHRGRDGVEKVLVGAKMIAAVLEGGVHPGFVGNEVGIVAVRVGVQAEAVAVGRAKQLEDVGKIEHPIAVGVAGIGRRRVPGGDRTDDHLCLRLHLSNGFTAQTIAASVHFRRNRLAARPARPFDRVIHLVADDPDFATARVLHKIGAAAGKVRITIGARNRAGRLVAVVQAHHHAVAAAAVAAVIAAAAVVRIRADGFGEQNPAFGAGLLHDPFAAGVVKTVDEI